jgi:uncharacterized membrane protein
MTNRARKRPNPVQHCDDVVRQNPSVPRAATHITWQRRPKVEPRSQAICPKKGFELTRECQPGISLVSIGLIALGALFVIDRDFAYTWQPVPAFHPGRDVLAIACGLFMIGAGVGLFFRATVAVAVRAVFAFLLAWMCLPIPYFIAMPQMEGRWLGTGEIAMLLAGGWVLFARLSGLEQAAFFSHVTGTKGIRIAQIIFGLGVLSVGLSHIVYTQITASLVRAWLPFRTGLAYLTGFGQIACGLAILFLSGRGRRP